MVTFKYTTILLLIINRIYDKTLFWCKNCFLLPTGSASKKYIDGATRLMHEWLQDFCFKAIMLMPNFLLQKVSKNSKSKEHLLVFEQRLDIWKEGEIKDLPLEGESIQVPLENTKETILNT